MKATALKGGKIRPIVVLGKALASAIAIGSGASAGREGPIVQIGSALGSVTGQLFHMSEARVKNLVACGAAAGISGVFNTPIAGVMFALEVILRDFGARALSTVVVASVSASVISRIFLGESPAFVVPVYSLWSPLEIFLYACLGVLSAFAAWLFVTVLHESEHRFDALKFPDWLKPAFGGLLIGIIGLYFPQVFGAGLHTIEEALHGNMGLELLLALVLLKILATSVSLGSGSSGGVFAPALFIGAVLGGAFGKLVYGHFPFEVAPPGAYALVGMACVFAAAAHAPVTAILIVFEMTGDYQMILPLMIATVIAASLAQVLRRESIYTMKLKERGIHIESLEGAAFLSAIQVRDAMSTVFHTIPRHLTGQELLEKMSREKDEYLYVLNSRDELCGVITSKIMHEVLLEKEMAMIIADDIATPVHDVCFPDESLSEAAHLLMSHHLHQIPIVDQHNKKKIVGVLKSENIFKAYTDLALKRDEIVNRMRQDDGHAGGALTIRFIIPRRSPVVQKALRELTIPDGVVLTSLQRKNKTVMPAGDTVLEFRDKVWAAVLPNCEDAFRAWLKENNLT